MGPLHLGVIAPNYGEELDPGELAAVAAAADDAGFDSIWVTDHLVVPAALAPVYGNIAEALVTLGFLAGRTTRIHLGVSALVVPQRQPLVTLKQVTTLDFLSGGRLLLAVASGWLEQEFETLGADFARRGSHLDGWLDLMESTIAQMPGRFAHEGPTAVVRDGWLAPALTRSDGIELWCAGAGDAALRRAARTGTWHPVALTPAELAESAARFREKRPDGRVVLRISTLFRDEPDPNGSDERGRHAIVGPPHWIAERLTEYARSGCDGFVVNLGHDTTGLDGRTRRFAYEVWPFVTNAQ